MSSVVAVALSVSAATLIPKVSAQAPAPPAPPAAISGDAKEFADADQLFQEGKWPEAMKALEAFRNKYKMLSPKSIEARYRLAIAYLQQKPKPLYNEAVAELRELLKNPKFTDPAAREQAQLLIAKAITMQGADMPSEAEPQKAAQAKIFETAIKEYDTFLQMYPQSRSGDTAIFLRASLLLGIERFDEAIKGFQMMLQRFPKSPLRNQAQMNIGKTHMAEGYGLMATKKGKEPTDEEMKRGLTVLESDALKELSKSYQTSQDVAIMNEAIYYVGQIQLTRGQNVARPDEEAQKKAQGDLLNSALEAFRAVRSREEVLQAQDEKINALRRAIQLLPPGTPDYLANKSYYENLISIEDEKKAKFQNEQDQFLGARLAIARIFLFLNKNDECRVLLRYLQGQKEVLEKEKDAQASIAALLASTYIAQKNTAKAQESFDAFRTAFKGHSEGDSLAVMLAELVLKSGNPTKAEEIVETGRADYSAAPGGWRFQVEATQLLIASAVQRGDLQKAMDLCTSILSSSPKPAVEMQTLFLKGTVERAMASEKGDGKMADQAIATFQVVRDKFPNEATAEDAWFEQCSILASRDANKALPELTSYLNKFSAGSGKSESTKTNVAVAQYRLAQVLDALGKKDEAIKAYQTLYTKWPESEPAPGAFFKIFDIYKDRKDYASCVKLMEEFVQKYPEHDNVYFAYSNQAEILYTNVLTAKPGTPNKPNADSIQAGAKKLYDYVEYEQSKSIKTKRGDGSLVRIADWWTKELSLLPAYMVLTNDQKGTWQKAVEGITEAIEKMLKTYPEGDRVGDGLERLVTAQIAMLKAQQIDVAKGEAYFRKLAEAAPNELLKSKILFALSAFLQDADAKKSADIRREAIKTAPAAAAAGEGDDAVKPTFTPADYDRYLSDLFTQKNYDEMQKVFPRVRAEYPRPKNPEAELPLHVQNAQATALFWEAKILSEQGKAVDAGKKFAELAERFPKSTKVFEADYGIIEGEYADKNYKANPTHIPRLQKIVANIRDVKDFELPAKALLLIGKIQEKNKEYESAITNYAKIYTRFESVKHISAEGLWRAAQLLEKQSTGEVPVRTPKELAALAAEKAAELKAAKEKEEKEKAKTDPAKKADGKDPKSSDSKPGDKKPEVAAAGPGAPKK